MKKAFLFISLFVLPIVAYLFFASGVNNFMQLPVLSSNIKDVSVFASIEKPISFKRKITVLGFLGDNLMLKKSNASNLNQMIYKRFHQFKDFQFVMMVPDGTQSQVAALKQELASITATNMSGWHFIFASPSQIQEVFSSLKTSYTLDKNHSTPYVFIIDKEGNLRGRKDDEDSYQGILYGFDATSPATINNKMEDDLKIVLAEYRAALKKNNVYNRKK